MSVLATAPFATAITVAGFLASAAYVAYRFGPALLRLSGWCSFWAAWVTGGQGGYGYCAAFLLLGLLASGRRDRLVRETAGAVAVGGIETSPHPSSWLPLSGPG